MNTVTVWLLFVMGTGVYGAPGISFAPSFATLQECQRVANVVLNVPHGLANVKAQCIQARVVKP